MLGVSIKVPVVAKKITYLEIDFIKGIAIIWIVLFHVYKDFSGYFISSGNGSGISWVHLIMFGPLGVNLFVICSGFLLSFSMHGKTETTIGFYFSRLKRLIPLYYSAIFFVLLMDFIFTRSNFSLNIYSLMQHLFLIHSFTDNMFDIQGAWWYMGMIIQFYLLFPLLYRLSIRLPFVYSILICIVFVVLARHIHFFNVDSNYSLFAFLPDFIIGIYLYKFNFPNQIDKYFIYLVFLCCLGIALLFYCMAFNIFVYSYWYGLARSLISIGIFMLLFIFYHYMIKPFHYVTVPITAFGRCSYAVYLFHRPFIYKFVTTLSLYVNKYLIIVFFLLFVFVLGYFITDCESRVLYFIRRRYV